MPARPQRLPSRPHLKRTSLIAVMCVAQVANLVSHVAVPALMTEHLIPLWTLTPTEAGVMSSAYQLGYMAAVPVLTSTTDRVDARLVFLTGSLLIAAATTSFGLFADGWLSASFIWALAGVGCAGAYMPGLRALTDRLEAQDVSRPITLYTGCFSVGIGLSFLIVPALAGWLGWRAAFVITGLAPLISALVAWLIGPSQPEVRSGPKAPIAAVLSNRKALGYILGYGAHCFELYGFRTWIVAFWGFVTARHGGDALISAALLSFSFSLLAFPASLIGNEGALRFGRARYVPRVMATSALIATAIGLSVSAPPALLLGLFMVYAFAMPGSSGALTAGMAMHARKGEEGVTFALHSMVGFAMAAVGGTAFGAALEFGGGIGSERGWTAGFLLMAAVIALGSVLVRTFAKD